MRLERIANPNDHFGFRRQRQNVRVQNFRAAGGERVRFVVAEIVEELGFGGLVGLAV